MVGEVGPPATAVDELIEVYTAGVDGIHGDAHAEQFEEFMAGWTSPIARGARPLTSTSRGVTVMIDSLMVDTRMADRADALLLHNIQW